MRSYYQEAKGEKGSLLIQTGFSCYTQSLYQANPPLICQGFSKFASLWSQQSIFNNVKLVTVKAR